MAFLKTIWRTNSRHEKLFEELAAQNAKDKEPESLVPASSSDNSDATFKLKYIGSTVVETISGENISSSAVKNIIKTAKSLKRNKLQTVTLNVSLQGISILDSQGNKMLKFSVYSISNCSTDAAHPQIFSFIATDGNETSECHAFLCSKRKMAQTVTLAVANAFSNAYQVWRQQPHAIDNDKFLQTTKENQQNSLNHITQDNNYCKNSSDILEFKDTVREERLIDLENEPTPEEIFCKDDWLSSIDPKRNWVSFEDDFHANSFKI